MEIPRLIEELRRPEAYPHPAGDPEVHQTHISVVFLAGDFAYKVKKPVDLGFVDYSTLDRRRRFCREEVRLNRRLAPRVYLGVVPVVQRGGRLFVDVEAAVAASGDGESEAAPAAYGDGSSEAGPGSEDVVEWAVRMRRLPADRTLESLLEREAVGADEMGDVAAHLAAFHAEAERSAGIARYGRFRVVAENFRDNFRQSREQVGWTVHADVFGRLEGRAESALRRRRGLIEERADRGVPCDTHGDLRLDHVYFLADRDVPVIVDCIEFNPAFRYADPVADMAFLAMDLEHAGRRDLAAGFADAYFRASGDEEGRGLLELYVAYRATVRGKVQGIKAAEEEVPPEEREAAAATATGHWLLALGALAPPRERPAMVLVGGLPGTGKSTLARGLAGEADFTVIRSDVVRKELAGLDPESSAATAYGRGIYTDEWSDRTYRACLERAEGILFRGGRVIVDASFHREGRRRAFLESAARHGVRSAFLVCDAPRDVALTRLQAREGDVSDAGPDVYHAMEGSWDRPDDATRRVSATVSTDGPVEASLRRALDAVRARGLL